MKLRGNCPAKVDEKGRLKVPAQFLEELKEYGTQFYITSISGEDARRIASRSLRSSGNPSFFGAQERSDAIRGLEHAARYLALVSERSARN